MKLFLLPLALVVALAAAAPAGAATARYEGTTSQQLGITIKLKGGSIDSLVVHVKNNCGATNRKLEIGGPIEIADNGKFNTGAGDGAFTVGGRFHGRSVHGRLRERVPNDIAGSGFCDTKKVKFVASLPVGARPRSG